MTESDTMVVTVTEIRVEIGNNKEKMVLVHNSGDHTTGRIVMMNVRVYFILW